MSPVYSIYTPFQEDDASSGGQTFLFALLNALIVVAIVIVMTVVLVCLFKYRCYRVRTFSLDHWDAYIDICVVCTSFNN